MPRWQIVALTLYAVAAIEVAVIFIRRRRRGDMATRSDLLFLLGLLLLSTVVPIELVLRPWIGEHAAIPLMLAAGVAGVACCIASERIAGK